MNPEHLLEQAERLLQLQERGAPRQADKRRAISAAYYAVFHFLMAAAANEFVGANRRGSEAYTLTYRSIAHGRVKAVCSELPKALPGAAWLKPVWPAGGFGRFATRFATLFVDLLNARHTADYDPTYKVNTAEVLRYVRQARGAITAFDRVEADERKLLLAMFVMSGRGRDG